MKKLQLCRVYGRQGWERAGALCTAPRTDRPVRRRAGQETPARCSAANRLPSAFVMSGSESTRGFSSSFIPLALPVPSVSFMRRGDACGHSDKAGGSSANGQRVSASRRRCVCSSAVLRAPLPAAGTWGSAGSRSAAPLGESDRNLLLEPQAGHPCRDCSGAEGIPSEPARTQRISENISTHFRSCRGSAAAVVGDLGAWPFPRVPAAPLSWDLRVCKENQSRQ